MPAPVKSKRKSTPKVEQLTPAQAFLVEYGYSEEMVRDYQYPDAVASDHGFNKTQSGFTFADWSARVIRSGEADRRDPRLNARVSTVVKDEPRAEDIVKTSEPRPVRVSKPKASPTANIGGLKAAQVSILKALAVPKTGCLNRKVIAGLANVVASSCTEYLGSTNADIRKKNDTKHYPSLITMEYVKFTESDDGVTFCITPKGRKFLTTIKG